MSNCCQMQLPFCCSLFRLRYGYLRASCRVSRPKSALWKPFFHIANRLFNINAVQLTMLCKQATVSHGLSRLSAAALPAGHTCPLQPHIFACPRRTPPATPPRSPPTPTPAACRPMPATRWPGPSATALSRAFRTTRRTISNPAAAPRARRSQPSSCAISRPRPERRHSTQKSRKRFRFRDFFPSHGLHNYFSVKGTTATDCSETGAKFT